MERWAHNQATPLCSDCDNTYHMCKFCRADSASAGKGGGKPGRPDGKGGGKPCVIERRFATIRGKGSGTPSGQATATQGGNQTERHDHVLMGVPLGSIKENPFHAPATDESVLKNIKDMGSQLAAKRCHSPTSGKIVARLLSAGVKSRYGKGLREMARRAKRDASRVTAEMMWIVTTSDPEGEDALYDVIKDRARELHIAVWSERTLNQAAAKVLEKTRNEFSEIQAKELFYKSQHRSMEG